MLNPGEYREKLESARVPKTVWTSTEKWYNECEYRNILESSRVPAKGGIRASAKKLSGPVRKNGRISVSTGKLLNPGEYWQKVASCEYRKTVRTSTEKWLNQCEFRKIVESGRVPGKAGIRASTENCLDQCGKMV